jgi:cytochrome b6-f complex iron-sulfur subunit
MTNRRTFLRTIFAGLGLTTVAAFLYPLLRYLSPLTGIAAGKQLVISKAEIPAGGAKEIIFNNTPAVIINRPEKGFIVLSRVCTHLGCLVDYQEAKGRLLCPCHAGTYDLDGSVTGGPPPKPLPKFPFKVERDSIVIG